MVRNEFPGVSEYLPSKKTKDKNCADFVLLVKRNTVLQIHNVLVMTRGLTYQKVMRKKVCRKMKEGVQCLPKTDMTTDKSI